MTSTSVLKLVVDDKEYNSTLKNAQQGLKALESSLQTAGKSFGRVDKSVLQYVQSIGKMDTSSKSARGSISEMSSAFVELSLQYNRMSDAVKQSDVGKALSQSLDTLRHRTLSAKEDLQGLERSLSLSSSSGSGGLLSGKLGGALQVFGGNLMMKAVSVVGDMASRLQDSVQEGIELARQGEGIRIAFERLGRGDILDGLREATHGTVTDIELMKAAVKFNDFRLPLNELGTMLAFAQQKAKDTGQSVDYMVESITNGLGRQSKPILDNLGISAKEIETRMKSTGDFTKAVSDIIRDQMSKAGDYVETSADRALQANVALQNELETLGQKLLPVSDKLSSMFSSAETSAIHYMNVAVTPLIPLFDSILDTGTTAFEGIGSIVATVADNTLRLMGPLGKLYGVYSDIAKMNIAMDAHQSGADIGGLLGTLLGDKSTVVQPFAPDSDNKSKQKYVKGGIKNVDIMSGLGIETYSSVGSLVQQQRQQQKALSNASNMWEEMQARSRLSDISWQLSDEGRQAAKIGLDRDSLHEMAETMAASLGDIEGLKFEKVEKSMSMSFEDFSESMKERADLLSGLSGGMSSIVGGLQQLGIEIPEGIQKAIGVMQAVAGILTGISSVVSIIATITGVKATPFVGWLFHTGGVVHAAGGYRVPGNYGYDAVPAMLTSGETVLTRAQAGNLASQLSERNAGQSMQPFVDGETIFLGMNNTSRRMGRGEIVTTSTLRRLGLI